MEMSIAAMSVGMAQQNVSQGLGVSVMKMAMGAMEDTGAMVAELADAQAMQLAAQPYLGGSLDILA